MVIESYNGGVREMPSIARQRLDKHIPVLRNVQTVALSYSKLYWNNEIESMSCNTPL